MSEMIKDQETSNEQGNAKRRRLVRGAGALAPVVLTLRSGALAAASCTGTKLITATDTNASIKETTARDGDFVLGPNPPADICVVISPGPDTEGCPQNKIVTRPYAETATLNKSGNTYYCGTGNGKLQTKQVAILSSTAANSLIGV